MIETLARALADAGLPVAAQDLCAIAWLALSMPPAPAPAPAPSGMAPPAPPPAAPLPPPTAPAVPASPPPAGPTGQRTTLFAASQQGHIQAGVLRVPGVLQAPPAPQLRRALQPFTRRVHSATRWQLDEEATAERRADTRVWELRYRRVRERWFDLHVVVDRGAGMDLWQGEVDALLRGLKSQGGFRSLQRWMLGGGAGAELSRRSDAPALPLAALHPPGQRPLVLLLTDGSAERWHTGAAQRWLWSAAERAPLALLQLMPPHAWRHTPLGEPVALGWWPRAGLPASALRLAGGDLDDALPDGWRAVPLVALAPAAVQRWALATTARGGATVPVALVGAAHAPVRRPRGEPDAAERVARFRHKASAAAFDLAVFLAVPDPLTLPVMRLVQRTMLPASGTAELAEFFSGGLLEPLAGAQPAWRLRTGVREALRGALRLSEERHIVDQLHRVGQALEAAGDDALGFEAWFPSAAGSGTLSEWALPFAEASRAVLRAAAPGQAPPQAPRVSSTEAPRASSTEAPGIAWRPCLSVSPDGSRIAVGDADGRIRFWDTVLLQPTDLVIDGHGSPLQCMAWTPDGRLLASAVAGGGVRLHRADGVREAVMHDGSTEPVALAISPDGTLLAKGSSLGAVRVWDIAALSADATTGPWSGGGLVQDLCFLAHGVLAVLRLAGRVDLVAPARPGQAARQLGADPRSQRLLPVQGGLLVAGPACLQRFDLEAGPAGRPTAQVQFDPEIALLAMALEGTDGVATLEAGGRVRFRRRDDLTPFDVTVQLEPDTAALASAPDGGLFALTRGGQLLQVPRPHRETAAAGGFLERVGVLQAVRDSGRLPEGEPVLDALRIFSTDTQQSWMVFTPRSLVLLLDDADTRHNLRLVQQVMPYDEAVPVNARIDRQGVATVGFAKARQRWFYTAALFATPALLEEAVATRAADIRLGDDALRLMRQSTVTITSADGAPVAGGYWIGEGLVATSHAALEAGLRATWQVQVPGRDTPLHGTVAAWDAAADAALLRVAEQVSMPLHALSTSSASTGRWLALGGDGLLIGGDFVDSGPDGPHALHLRESLPSLNGALAAQSRGAPVWSGGTWMAVLGHLSRIDEAAGLLRGCHARRVLALRDRMLQRRQVFLCASHRDAAWDAQLRAVLQGVDATLTPAPTLAAGEGWGEMSEAIAASGLAIVVCTPAWAASEFVQREFEVLLRRRASDPSFGILVLAPPGGAAVPALADLPTVQVAGDRLSDDEAALLRLLLQAWTDPHGPLQAARQLVRMRAFTQALQVLQGQADASELVSLQAQALRGLGRPTETLAMVERWLAAHDGDLEPLTERALAWRAIWQLAPEDLSAARQAALDFERAWHLSRDPWRGVCAAALWLRLGDRRRSQQFAQEAAERGMAQHASGQQGNPLLAASIAEACVLLGRFDDARQWLRRQNTPTGHDLQPLASAIRGHLAALGEEPTLLDDVLRSGAA